MPDLASAGRADQFAFVVRGDCATWYVTDCHDAGLADYVLHEHP